MIKIIKNNIKLFAILLFIVIIILCLILFAFVFVSSKKSSSVQYISNVGIVTLKPIISVSDTFGKTIEETNGGAFGYVEFKVKNTGQAKTNFQVFITLLDSDDKLISPYYVKFYLTDENDNSISFYNNKDILTYVDLKVIDDLPNSKLLYTGSISADTTNSYRLRVWLDDAYVINNNLNKEFSFQIDARAT